VSSFLVQINCDWFAWCALLLWLLLPNKLLRRFQQSGLLWSRAWDLVRSWSRPKLMRGCSSGALRTWRHASNVGRLPLEAYIQMSGELHPALSVNCLHLYRLPDMRLTFYFLLNELNIGRIPSVIGKRTEIGVRSADRLTVFRQKLNLCRLIS